MKISEDNPCPECGGQILLAPAIGYYCTTKDCNMGIPKPEFEIRTTESVAAEAYQVIGTLAYSTETFDKPGVQKALDYFGDIANGEPPTRAKEILPWDIE